MWFTKKHFDYIKDCFGGIRFLLDELKTELGKITISVVSLAGIVRGMEQDMQPKFDRMEQMLHREIGPVLKTTAQYLTELIKLKSEIENQRRWYEDQLQKDRLFLQNMLQFIVHNAPPPHSSRIATPMPVPFNPFEDLPLDHPEGYTRDELMLPYDRQEPQE